MGEFDVATDELVRLAKKVQAAGKALDRIGTTAAGLTLASDAFGHLSDSAEVSASYNTLQERLADGSKQGGTVLDDVDGGLHDVAKTYRAVDAHAESMFKGK